ncbi:MAG: hypothetical protein HY566_02770 [Candidatus Kerfeldbacteria bacterium]|nr:hypothetical protein [Candidatus Kerfeldbacteria bacterium]
MPEAKTPLEIAVTEIAPKNANVRRALLQFLYLLSTTNDVLEIVARHPDIYGEIQKKNRTRRTARELVKGLQLLPVTPALRYKDFQSEFHRFIKLFPAPPE